MLEKHRKYSLGQLTRHKVPENSSSPGKGGKRVDRCSARACMSEALPVVYIARHGETAWSLSGQHTGLTDLPLTSNGERNARRLGERLKGMTFEKVLPAHCSARPEPANWLGLDPWPKSIL